MVKDHSERGNLLLPLHSLLFPISSRGSFIYNSIARIMAFGTPVMEH